MNNEYTKSSAWLSLGAGCMNVNLELLLWFCFLKSTPINLLNSIWDKFNVWEILPVFCFRRKSAKRGSPKYFDNILASELWANIPTANCEIMSSSQIWELPHLSSSRLEWNPEWQMSNSNASRSKLYHRRFQHHLIISCLQKVLLLILNVHRKSNLHCTYSVQCYNKSVCCSFMVWTMISNVQWKANLQCKKVCVLVLVVLQ